MPVPKGGGSVGVHRQPYTVGSGSVSTRGQGILLEKGVSSGDQYSNAQIDDYHEKKRRDFFWHPPLRLTLRARFSHPGQGNASSDARGHVTGTSGFGFWNDPFLMTGLRVPTLPRAIWFFYSSKPSNIRLAREVPGWGWKASVIDCLRLPFFLLLPTAPLGIVLMRFSRLYQLLWPIAQRAMHHQEAKISQPMDCWHTYDLVWRRNSARFLIDNSVVLETSCAPRGPLGLVIWLDNQSMIVEPTGVIRSGLVANEEVERLEIEDLHIGRNC